jgi:hypothetical protein
METLNRLYLTDLITASRAHAHTARRLAKAHRHSRVRSRPPHTQRLHALAARLIPFFRFGAGSSSSSTRCDFRTPARAPARAPSCQTSVTLWVELRRRLCCSRRSVLRTSCPMRTT